MMDGVSICCSCPGVAGSVDTQCCVAVVRVPSIDVHNICLHLFLLLGALGYLDPRLTSPLSCRGFLSTSSMSRAGNRVRG